MDRLHLPGDCPVIDCDLHCVVPAVQALFPYLPSFWQEYIRQSAFQGPVATAYPAGAPPAGQAWDHAAIGAPAGSDLALLREQVLDAWGVEFGILQCAYAVESVHNPDAAAILARAVNDWQEAEWLAQEPRLRASIVVPYQDGSPIAHGGQLARGHLGDDQALAALRRGRSPSRVARLAPGAGRSLPAPCQRHPDPLVLGPRGRTGTSAPHAPASDGW